MIFKFGKHSGDEVGKVLLKDPDYIIWALDQQDANGAMRAVQTEAKKLIAKLDGKPLTHACAGCGGKASYFTGYVNNASSLYSWCESCNSYGAAADQGKLVRIRTFSDAMSHVRHSCGDTKSGRKSIVKSMAQAKGLPNRVGDAQVDAFFA